MQFVDTWDNWLKLLCWKWRLRLLYGPFWLGRSHPRLASALAHLGVFRRVWICNREAPDTGEWIVDGWGWRWVQSALEYRAGRAA